SPLMYLAGEDVGFMSTEEKQKVLDDAGLNDPLFIQYGNYLKDIVTGNFGYSYQQKKPIVDLLKERIPWTLLLAGLNLIIATFLGVIFGAISAWKRGTRTDVNMLTF